MLKRPLQFEPGERRAYANFGFCVLGRVAEKVSQQDYFTALEARIFKPLGIVDIALARKNRKDRNPREVLYSPAAEQIEIEALDAPGGLVASAPALGQFLTHFWIDGTSRKQKDEPQDWVFFGSLPGTTALVRQSAGWDVAILFNGRRDEHFLNDHQTLLKAVNQSLTKLEARK
jgi:CubicO group peptidase (beta-lactamase class C family)